MKSAGVLKITLLLTVLTSCTTVNYSISDIRRGEKPIKKSTSYLTSAVPGLSQILNKEYAEGFTYIGLTGLFTLGALNYQEIYNSSEPHESDDTPEKYLTAYLGSAVLTWIWSYVDGVISTDNLNKQKIKLEKSIVEIDNRPPEPEKKKFKYTIDVHAEDNIDLVKINVLPIWVNAEPRLNIPAGFYSFKVSINNISDKIIRVVWEKSSINYGSKSYTPFIDGQKYIESSIPLAPTAIPANGKISKILFSAEQPSFQDDDWIITPIAYREITLLLYFESSNGGEYYSITIKGNAEPGLDAPEVITENDDLSVEMEVE